MIYIMCEPDIPHIVRNQTGILLNPNIKTT
jgi:hypothetical protein